MSTNQGPHEGDRNSNNHLSNCSNERYDNFAFRQEGSRHSLPTFSSLMKEILSSNLDKQAISWEPTANDRSKGFQQSYHIPTLQKGIADVSSSLPLEMQQYAAELQDQRTKSDKLTHDVARLTQDVGNLTQLVDTLTQNSDRIHACFPWVKNLLDSFTRDVSISRNASVAVPEVNSGSDSLISTADIHKKSVSLENGATTCSNNSAPSISTAFASHRPDHAPQPSQPHQQLNPHQSLRPVSLLAPPNQPTFYEGVDPSTSRGPTTKRTSKKRSLSFSMGNYIEEHRGLTASKRANLASFDSRVKYWTNGNAKSVQQYSTPTQSNCSPYSQTHPNRADVPGGVIVGSSSEASGSVNSENKIGWITEHALRSPEQLVDPKYLTEEEAFLMIRAVVKEEGWSEICNAFRKQFPNAASSRQRLRYLYYAKRLEWGLPPARGRNTEGKIEDKKAVKEIVLSMQNVQHLHRMVLKDGL